MNPPRDHLACDNCFKKYRTLKEFIWIDKNERICYACYQSIMSQLSQTVQHVS
jgi:hypothetical protein